MRLGTRSRRSLLTTGIALICCALFGGSLAAQPAAGDLKELAARVIDSKAPEKERVIAATKLLSAPESAALEHAFDVLAATRNKLATLVEDRLTVDERLARKDGEFKQRPADSKLTDEEWAAQQRAEELERIRGELESEEGMLLLLQVGLRKRLRKTPDEPTIGKLVVRVAGTSEPAARAEALRVLGYFPSAAARTALFSYVSAKPIAEVTGAVAGFAEQTRAEQARAEEGAPREALLWLDAYTTFRKLLARAWKDRDAAHRAYLAQSEKHVKYLNKLGAQTTKQIQKLLRGAKPKALPESARRKLAKLEAERKQLAEALRAQEALVAALHDGLGGAFACLSAAQRARPEASLVGALAKPTHQESSLRLVALCGRLHSDAIRGALEKAAEARAPEVRLAACDALGRHADPAAVPVLAACLQDPFWQVRTAAIRALRASGGKQAVGALVVGLVDADGLVQHEMNAALAALTGQDFHTNAVLWRDWWAKNRAGYVGPPGDAAGEVDPSKPPLARADEEGAEAGRKSGAVSFYGIRSRSKRVVFVLDVSGSMYGDINKALPPGTILRRRPDRSDQKISHARKQMQRTIVSLPPDAVFNIVTYGDLVKAWKKDVVRATPKNKAAAKKWVGKIEPEGQTNIFDALARALGMVGKGDRLQVGAADTIYLLTDGRANRGAVIDPTEILDEIERLNASRKVTIHTVALGRGADASFMRRLAERFNGRFVHLKGKKKDDDPFGR